MRNGSQWPAYFVRQQGTTFFVLSSVIEWILLTGHFVKGSAFLIYVLWDWKPVGNYLQQVGRYNRGNQTDVLCRQLRHDCQALWDTVKPATEKSSWSFGVFPLPNFTVISRRVDLTPVVSGLMSQCKCFTRKKWKRNSSVLMLSKIKRPLQTFQCAYHSTYKYLWPMLPCYQRSTRQEGSCDSSALTLLDL